MEKEKKAKPKYLTKALPCPDGTRKYIRAKTKAELDRKVAIARAELGLGINLNDNTTVVEFAQMWVDVYKRPNIKPQTVKNILNHLNTHILPVIGAMKMRAVKPADCARVMSSMSGMAQSTVKYVRSTMKEMFECGVENHIIAGNPVRKSVVARGRDPRRREPLTPEQLGLLCSELLGRKWADLYTFVLLCAYAGLREGEALGLHLDNVDTDAGVLYVREQYISLNGQSKVYPELKSKAAYRTIPMPPVLLAHMIALKRELGTGRIFDVEDPSLNQKFIGRLRRMCRVAPDGSPRSCRKKSAVLDFYVHPHLLRHTYATICIQNGMDVKEVQYLLGHSSPSMTLCIYSHYQAEQRRQDTAKKLVEAFPAQITALG